MNVSFIAGVAGQNRVVPVAEMPTSSGTARIDYAHWANLVRSIEAGDAEGTTELYKFFGTNLRYHLCRQTGLQDLEDRLHNLFILIVEAIRRREIREPERLMGFVRTVTRRQVLAHIRHVVAAKIEVSIEGHLGLASVGGDPEEVAILRQRDVLVRLVLNELSGTDHEILERFYLQEQSESTICQEMGLTGTQFRLHKSRAKARFGELGKKKLRTRRGAVRPVFGMPLCTNPPKTENVC